MKPFVDSRGFTTAASGLPDEMRAARLVLKDYVNVCIFLAIDSYGILKKQNPIWPVLS